MTLEEYKILPGQVQEMVLFNEGHFIDAILRTKSVIALYSLFSFFVRLEYDTVNYRIAPKGISCRKNFDYFD